jgi:hypothetical protein
MKKIAVFYFLISVISISNAFAIFINVEGIEDAYIKRVAISALDENLIYVGSKNSLFRSKDQGKKFEKIYGFKNEEVKHIIFDPLLYNITYVAATRNAYKITDKIERVFTAPEETFILSIAKYKGEIYIGTSAGLYYADESILNWKKIPGTYNDFSIQYIEPSEAGLYLATNKGLYLLKSKDKIERLFVIREKEIEAEEESGLAANIVKVDIFDKNKIWLGTNRGLYVSQDNAKTWNKLYLNAIDNLNTYSLAQTPLEKNSIYLGSPKGFFKIDLSRKVAQQISEGLFSNEIFWVEFSKYGEIYLATSRGLFVNAYFTASSAKDSLDKILKKQPSIQEVQQAALRYNEVHPDKIRYWRNALKFRGLFPTFSLDYDKTISVYQNSTIDRAYIGPRDWGASFSWNIGDLVWNTYEDDVDTRSRLNTQLRIDILDEINRVYFERLRLERELSTVAIAEEELFQKSLRLQELTAIIDGYTGGFYSKRINELKIE